MDTGAKHLVELKARYEDLGKARALLAGATSLGTFVQSDTYFSVGERRLKLRTVDGVKEGQLVYYERPDASGVKESRVLLASVSDAGVVREMLTRVLPVKAESARRGRCTASKACRSTSTPWRASAGS